MLQEDGNVGIRSVDAVEALKHGRPEQAGKRQPVNQASQQECEDGDVFHNDRVKALGECQ